MKRSKTITAVILSVLMALSLLAGCGYKQMADPGSAGASGAASTAATDWPKKTIQIVCPFAPGGDTDFNARTISKYLTKELGVDTVIVSTEGNGGAVGSRKAKESANDGYTVLMSSSAFITNQLSGATDFGIDAFEFSGIFGQGPGNVVCVNPDLGVKDIEGLIEYSKANPKKLKIAANTGATTHVIALMLQKAGIDGNIIDAGASADRIAALLGGHVDVIINSYGSVKDYISSGKFVALGLDSQEEPEFITGIPTLTSLGYDIAFPSYYFFAFPKGTDQAIVDKFTKAVEKVVTTNADYAADIQKGYYQSPQFYGGTEGLDKFNVAKEKIQSFQTQLSGK
ncbi:tripartite tricarboxylate transporter substrate binding protein [Marasmitruncus massiliensis]|uniref:tripartite tricarboxylate transporter substrate binding protein n=1 Tax=Marasmitruncus massiliensis TaxID=1944642 RepID=UPI0015E0FAE0|nr:tripartite tricarboxylate transporter substrate binding protein [Marasmitruncus massiliensis]